MPRKEYDRFVFAGRYSDTFGGTRVYTPHYVHSEGEVTDFPIGKEGNYLYNRLGDLPIHMDVGHEMALYGRKSVSGFIPVGQIWRGGENQAMYEGGFQVEPGFYYTPHIPTAEPYMVEAYKKMKPTKPAGGLVNSLFELRELPGMLKGKLFGSPLRTISNIHLAYQFGWKPLLQEIATMIEIQTNAQRYLKQLLRDEGKPVRRRITVYDKISDPEQWDERGYWAVKPILVTQFYAYEPKVRNILRTRDRIWASALFRYWLPAGPRDIKYADRLLKSIKGGDITPSVLWNALPWSWLIDWFHNFGDVIENLEAGVADRLIADRFYGMRQTERTHRRFVDVGFARQSGELVNFHGSAYNTTFTKSRIKGDPFGFGTKQNELSSFQLSILGALGISRLTR